MSNIQAIAEMATRLLQPNGRQLPFGMSSKSLPTPPRAFTSSGRPG